MKPFKILSVVLIGLFSYYLLIPNPKFPAPLDDALQSNEPGDTETNFRRAYFTDYSREEVMNHYKNEFRYNDSIFKSSIQISLNYPPESAQQLVRDQTRSTFLEELIHPFRGYLFVNGFEPKEDKDAILINDKFWKQKITVKYIPTSAIYRTSILLITSILLTIILKEWEKYIIEITKIIKRK